MVAGRHVAVAVGMWNGVDDGSWACGVPDALLVAGRSHKASHFAPIKVFL